MKKVKKVVLVPSVTFPSLYGQWSVLFLMANRRLDRLLPSLHVRCDLRRQQPQRHGRRKAEQACARLLGHSLSCRAHTVRNAVVLETNQLCNATDFQWPGASFLLEYTGLPYEDRRYVQGNAPGYSREHWFGVKVRTSHSLSQLSTRT